MNKFKKVLLALLAVLVLFSVITLAACRKPEEEDDGGDNKFDEYSYNYGGVSADDGIDLEFSDTDMTLDGIVNTAEYGTQYLSITDVNGVNAKVYAHMGNEGVFFGFVSSDTHVNYNTNNSVSNNTSVEVQVAANATNSSVVRLRLGANGTVELSQGTPSGIGYNYSSKYIQSMGMVHVNGKLNGTANGYSVELYLPYTSLGLTATPDSVVCAPSFNTLTTSTATQRTTWATVLGCDMSHADSWYVVNETGITANSAGYNEKSTGIVQEQGGNEFYYFGMQPVSAYYLKTQLTVLKTNFLNNDNNPKYGLVSKSDNALQAFYIDATDKTGTNFGTVTAVQSASTGTNWQYNNSSTSFEGHWGNSLVAGKSNYHTQNLPLEVIYYEGDLYFILGDVLVKTVKDFAPASQGAIPGLMCMNTKATFTKNEYETDSAKVKTEVEKYKAKDATIDGDLSDWTDTDVNNHARTVTDSENGNTMTVRAFRGSDGLYVAYEVTHKVNRAASSWSSNWQNNTYVELYVNGNGEANHYALTTFGNSGYMDGVMTTSSNANAYKTVAEIFIPFASLTKDGFNLNDTLKVSFGFSSNDGTDNGKLNGVTLWTLGSNPISVYDKGVGEQYLLTYSVGDDDDVTGDAPQAANIFAGDTVKLATPTFTRDGYTFVGWTDGTYAYVADSDYTMPDHDVTLAPVWVAADASGTHSVIYAAGTDVVYEGELPVDNNTYAAGEVVTVMDTTITREGYRFAGWSDGNKNYAVGSKIFMGGSDITLTAVWSKLYDVTYEKGHANATGDLPDSEWYVEGEIVTVVSANITREGYEFAGWKLENNNTVYQVGDTFEMLGEDVTLTAVWKIKITVDGDLKDWNELGTKTIGSKALTGSKQATWYGVLRDDGLYLAVDITHSELGYGQNDWWNNLNFEIHLGAENIQQYVYVNGRTGSSFTGYNYTIDYSSLIQADYKHSGGSLLSPMHRSTFEVFVPDSVISPLKEADGSLRIGVAIKTNGESEKFTGGTHNYSEGDPWFMPYGVRADVYDDFAYVTKDGMYLKNEYLHPNWQFGAKSAVVDDNSITLDGDVSDWTTDNTINIKGTDLYNGKSATFYGKMTQAGLYLAVDAYHSVFTYGQDEWWNNTNFELRIGETFTTSNDDKLSYLRAKQYWVYATGANTFAASDNSMKIKYTTGREGNMYHTVIEIFISASDLVKNDYMVQNGMIHVGIAWKTNNDTCNDLGVDNGAGSWWVPKDTHINTNPACVTGNGIYTAKEYQSLVK